MLALVLFALCLANTQALGALHQTTAPGITIRWTGGVGTSWQNSSNWDPARVPGPHDSVIIRPPTPGATCTVTARPPVSSEKITVRSIDARDCSVNMVTSIVADTITIARSSNATTDAVLSVGWTTLQATKYGAVSTDVKFGGGTVRGNWSFTGASLSLAYDAQFSGTFAFGVATKHGATKSTGPTGNAARRVIMTIDDATAEFTPMSSVTFGAHALVLCRSGRCHFNGGLSETVINMRDAAVVVREKAKFQIEMFTAYVGAVHLASTSELCLFDAVVFLTTVISTAVAPGGNTTKGPATLTLASFARVTAYGGLHALSVSDEPVLLDLDLQQEASLTILEPPTSRTAPLVLNSIQCSGELHFGLNINVREASSLTGVMKELIPTAVHFSSLNTTGGALSVTNAAASHLRLYAGTNIITPHFEVTDSLYISAVALRGTLRAWPRCEISLDSAAFIDGIANVPGPAPLSAAFIADAHFTVPGASFLWSSVIVSLTRGATVLGMWQATPGPQRDAVFNATGAVVLGVGGSVSGQGAASIKNAIPGPGAQGHLVIAECMNKSVSFPLRCPVGGGFKIDLE